MTKSNFSKSEAKLVMNFILKRVKKAHYDDNEFYLEFSSLDEEEARKNLIDCGFITQLNDFDTGYRYLHDIKHTIELNNNRIVLFPSLNDIQLFQAICDLRTARYLIPEDEELKICIDNILNTFCDD